MHACKEIPTSHVFVIMLFTLFFILLSSKSNSYKCILYKCIFYVLWQVMVHRQQLKFTVLVCYFLGAPFAYVVGKVFNKPNIITQYNTGSFCHKRSEPLNVRQWVTWSHNSICTSSCRTTAWLLLTVLRTVILLIAAIT